MNGDFSLWSTIDEVLEYSSDQDIDRLTKQVVAEVPRGQLTAALEQALRIVIAQRVTARFRQTRSRIGQGHRTASRRSPGLAPLVSRLLGSNVNVGGVYKQFGTCDRTDLGYLASVRREHAEENLRWAERFDDFADALKRYRVRTVADLPADVIEEIAADEEDGDD